MKWGLLCCFFVVVVKRHTETTPNKNAGFFCEYDKVVAVSVVVAIVFVVVHFWLVVKIL